MYISVLCTCIYVYHMHVWCPKKLEESIGSYGGMNEDEQHRLINPYSWSSAGGTVWEGLGGVVLLEEVSH